MSSFHEIHFGEGLQTELRSQREQAFYSYYFHNPIPAANQQPTMNHRRFLIKQCTQILNHAARCVTVDCPVPNCAVMKRVWKHVMLCQARKTTRKCKVCSNVMILLSYHAKHCQNSLCNVLYCSTLKNGQH